MINTFSLILAIITGISGIFWGIKKIYILVYKYGWENKRFFITRLTDIFEQPKNVYVLLIDRCVNIVNFISSLFPILLLVFVIRSFIIEPFQIPSGSMMPTLLIGDFILVNKFVYGIKNPVTQKTIIDINHPKRGDVVVFKYPKDPKLDYIKRVIGKPGDKIIYNIVSKQLIIYPNDSTDGIQAQSLPIIYSNIIPSSFIQEFHTAANGVVDTTFIQIERLYQEKFSRGIRLVQSTESLDGIEHDILTMIPPGNHNFIKMYNQNTMHLASEWIVPIGEYFVMGDNRDNSSDSRYWGCVPERNIVGKATIVWMSLKKQTGEWPTGIRLHRMGSNIQ